MKRFFELESSAGLILLFFAANSILFANSPWASLFISFQHHGHFIVNDVLMSFFFLLVGLELKREFLFGELKNSAHIISPLIGALGGMLIPAWIFSLTVHSYDELTHAWSIPVATDIAFALGTLSLFGKRVPLQLKLFLMNLAIFDDIGAIVIISLFFTTDLNVFGFALSAVTLLLFHAAKSKPLPLSCYLGLGALLWYGLFLAHIHPTLSGILTALFIPAQKNPAESTLHALEEWLHPWVAFGIMPLFAFLNAGFGFDIIQFNTLFHPLIAGIVLGLFLGKPIGILSSLYLIRLFSKHPPPFNRWHDLGIACLCGIGFTMSLFLGQLSFPGNDSTMGLVKFAVLFGSLLSAVTGFLILKFTLPK